MKSELRLIETLDGICDRVLQYNIHKVSVTESCSTIYTRSRQLSKRQGNAVKFQERKDSTRFAKGQSETFSTLEGLVAKGVKVGNCTALH